MDKSLVLPSIKACALQRKPRPQATIPTSSQRGVAAVMEEAARKEEVGADKVRQLLNEERKLWSSPCVELVSNRVEEMCCGWKQVRPLATYDLRKPTANKRRKAVANASSTLSVTHKDDKSPENWSYMSGELDEDYSYVYRGGLSSRTVSEPQMSNLGSHFSPPRKHVRTVTLEPSATSEASVHALAHCRDELSRILALQLKPELLVEQLIIENRLRTMSLAAFPVLEAGGGGESTFRRNERTYSQSTPSLGNLPNTHVDYRPPRHRQQCRGKERTSRHRTAAAKREARQPHLQWCNSLSSHKSNGNQIVNSDGAQLQAHWPLPELSHQPSTFHHRRLMGPASHFRHSSIKPASNTPSESSTRYPQRHFTDNTTDTSTQYRLPVVSPTLTAFQASNGQETTGRHMHTLLYKPDSGNKPSSLATGSSFYYPSISYSNSKPMRK